MLATSSVPRHGSYDDVCTPSKALRFRALECEPFGTISNRICAQLTSHALRTRSEFAEQFDQCSIVPASFLPQFRRRVEVQHSAVIQNADEVGELLRDFENLRRKKDCSLPPGSASRLL